MKFEQFLSRPRNVAVRALPEFVQPSPGGQRDSIYQSFVEDQRATASRAEFSPLVRWAQHDQKERGLQGVSQPLA